MTTVDSPAVGGIAPALRRLYFVRFAFAIVWAALVFVTTKSGLGPAGVVLVVVYPLFDVAAAIVDARSSRSTGSARGLYVNMAISLIAAIGLGIACASGIPGVLRVWGAWAIVAGLVQLIVALTRRTMGGQWAMILSGGISVLAGANFILGASAPDPSLTNVAGYAVLGGIFFLISALRLGSAAKAR
ncbi:membrane protein [Amycolatopsis ultiminotia]|uniref:Membrane protein n=1 Tax=Amycolatopsis ultiminotia TaxID=543629 RepID=A0ABP6XBV6_9PSEU